MNNLVEETPVPPAVSRQEFLAALEAISKHRSLGQRDIATVAGVDESQLSRIRRGQREASLPTAASIISIFEEPDQRVLVTAWLHDAIRGLGFEPEKFPIGNPSREPQLTDMADPALAKTVRELLARVSRNPAIRQCLKSLEEMTRPVEASPAKRIAIARSLTARKRRGRGGSSAAA